MSQYIKEEMNPQIRQEKFENKIKSKYKGYVINNVDTGIKHIKMVKYYNGKPVKINVVEMNSKVASNYEVKPAIASVTLPNKRTVRNIAQRTNSIVAINGGFFKPQTGVPLGTLMIDKKSTRDQYMTELLLEFSKMVTMLDAYNLTEKLSEITKK